VLPFLVTLALASAFPRKAPVSLTELCRFSDVIVIGTVERVARVTREPRASDRSGGGFDEPLPDEVPIADVRVQRVLKGSVGIEHVLYVSVSRWACDTTTASVGETAFFFFGDSSSEKELDGSFRRDVRTLFPKGELMTVLRSGDGRMPVHGSCVDCSAYPVWGRPKVSAHDPKCRNEIACVPLDWMSKTIPAICEKQRAAWIRASVSQVGGEGVGWDLEMTGDRHVHLVVHNADGDHARDFVASERAVIWFESRVNWAVKEAPPSTLGTGHDPLGERHLEILGESRAFDVRILSLDAEWMLDPAHLAETRPSLGVWEQVRGLIDDAVCADHRAEDKPWLDRRE